MKETVVVVGYGWVGQANALSFLGMGYPIAYFDVAQNPKRHYGDKYSSWYEQIPKLDNVLHYDSSNTTYVVCVGDVVSPEGVQDISAIKSALEPLKNAKGTVVLRSTIIPNFLSGLHFDFYVPEFLHEKMAVEECANPHFFIVGSKSPSKKEPGFFKEWRKRSHKSFQGTPEEASYIKYLSNIWNSTRIAFVNEFGNAISLPKTKDNLRTIQKVTDFLFEGRSYMRYGKSFGGHCLPKDTRAFVYHHKNNGKEMHFFEGVLNSNQAHQKVEKENKILPEWYSEWRRAEISGREALKALKKIIAKKVAVWK